MSSCYTSLFPDCRVEIAVDGGDKLLNAHNVLIVTLITSSCAIANREEFDLRTSALDFMGYIESLPIGTVVIGVVGPGLTKESFGVIDTLAK
jgi:hypothetical protein